MDLIDRAELLKNDEVTEWLSNDAIRTGKMLKAFSELFVKKVESAQKVDAIPLSVIEEIKAEIENYYLDCDFSVYDKDENCKKCNDNVFNSIRNIIDRKIKEIES